MPIAHVVQLTAPAKGARQALSQAARIHAAAAMDGGVGVSWRMQAGWLSLIWNREILSLKRTDTVAGDTGPEHLASRKHHGGRFLAICSASRGAQRAPGPSENDSG